MRDLIRQPDPMDDVMAFDFTGGRTAAMNQSILDEMKTKEPTSRRALGENIGENRATKCLFAVSPLPPGLQCLKRRLYKCLEIYLGHCRPDLTDRPFHHRSWCNHYQPNEGMPWHDHANTPVVAVYYVKGHGGDLIVADPSDPNKCFRVETPPGRVIFMKGALRHCSTPNFGPYETRVSLPVNFYFAERQNA